MMSIWSELRVQVNNEQRDQVLEDVVCPFFEEIMRHNLASRGYFFFDQQHGQSYWCLRLDAPSQADRFATTLRAIIADRCLPLHVEQPSLAQGGFTAHEEIVQGADAQALLEDFLCETTPFLLDLIAQVKANKATRLSIAFDLMVAHVVAMNKNIFAAARRLPYPNTFLSYRSHADGYFVGSARPQATREAFEQRYATVSMTMQQRLTRLLQQLNEQGSVVSHPAQDWTLFVQTYVDRVVQGLSSGQLQKQTNAGISSYLGDNHDLSVSSFHQSIQDDKGYQDFMKTDNEFYALRIMASLLYLTLHRFGLHLSGRYFLCHAVSRSFEHVFNVDPTDVLAAIRQHVPKDS